MCSGPAVIYVFWVSLPEYTYHRFFLLLFAITLSTLSLALLFRLWLCCQFILERVFGVTLLCGSTECWSLFAVLHFGCDGECSGHELSNQWRREKKDIGIPWYDKWHWNPSKAIVIWSSKVHVKSLSFFRWRRYQLLCCLNNCNKFNYNESECRLRERLSCRMLTQRASILLRLKCQRELCRPAWICTETRAGLSLISAATMHSFCRNLREISDMSNLLLVYSDT